MTANEKFLTQRQRYQPVTLPQDFSDELPYKHVLPNGTYFIEQEEKK